MSGMTLAVSLADETYRRHLRGKSLAKKQLKLRLIYHSTDLV